MQRTQEQIEKLYTLQESNDAIARAVENGAKEATLLAESVSIKQAIAEAKPNVDLSGVESGLQEVKNAVENIELPEIDTSAIAKQGENAEATNTAILAEIKAINDLKNIYSVRFEQNQDGDNTYTMVLPLVAGIVGDTIIM